MKTTQLREAFKEVFGVEADHTFFSPGRINLIGEHTDYNGGHVFPAAITLGTYGAARKRDDKVLRFFSGNFEDKGIIEVPLENLRFEKEHNKTSTAESTIVNRNVKAKPPSTSNPDANLRSVSSHRIKSGKYAKNATLFAKP